MEKAVIISDRMLLDLLAGVPLPQKRNGPEAIALGASIAAFLAVLIGLGYVTLLLIEAGVTEISEEIRSPTEAYKMSLVSEER